MFTILNFLIIIIICAIGNVLRGSKAITKLSYPALVGASVYWYTDYIFTAITVLGVLLWIVPAWGNGLFTIIHSSPMLYDTKENPWINKLIPIDINKNPTTWGLVYMGIRGLFIMPMFLALALYTGKLFVCFFGFIGILFGLAYLLGRSIDLQNAVRIGEVIIGVLIGGLLAWTVFSAF